MAAHRVSAWLLTLSAIPGLPFENHKTSASLYPSQGEYTIESYHTDNVLKIYMIFEGLERLPLKGPENNERLFDGRFFQQIENQDQSG